MRSASRLYVVPFLALAVAVGVVTFHQRRDVGASGAAPAAVTRTVIPADDDSVYRMQAKNTVTRRLIDGELTLRDAAAWFQYLDALAPTGVGQIQPGEEGLSVQERCCREAIRWATGQADALPPSQAKRLERRLQAELNAFLKRDGRASPVMQ